MALNWYESLPRTSLFNCVKLFVPARKFISLLVNQFGIRKQRITIMLIE